MLIDLQTGNRHPVAIAIPRAGAEDWLVIGKTILIPLVTGGIFHVYEIKGYLLGGKSVIMTTKIGTRYKLTFGPKEGVATDSK